METAVNGSWVLALGQVKNKTAENPRPKTTVLSDKVPTRTLDEDSKKMIDDLSSVFIDNLPWNVKNDLQTLSSQWHIKESEQEIAYSVIRRILNQAIADNLEEARALPD